MRPMLASKSDDTFERGVLRAVNDDSVLLDPKLDGDRLLVELTGGGHVQAFNRKGEPTNTPAPVREALRGAAGALAAASSFVFDGEWLADMGEWWVFDAPVLGAEVGCGTPLLERREMLDRLFAVWAPAPCIQVAPWARTQEGKAALAQTVIRAGGEGLIVKRASSPYVPPARPDQRSKSWTKLKMVHDVDCFVTRLRVDGKQNYEVAVHDADGAVKVIGECSALTGDGPRVQVGDVVTITYLYVLHDRLVQPVKGRIRTDKTADECTIDQLHTIDRVAIRDAISGGA
jgi:ATP-dependent DNA ligase